ncbi:MAG: hypothetical protein M3Y25_04365 [Thermoproteota archaeon]|nr:hypothetical protein [Thermoproteota archaeon]
MTQLPQFKKAIGDLDRVRENKIDLYDVFDITSTSFLEGFNLIQEHSPLLIRQKISNKQHIIDCPSSFFQASDTFEITNQRKI